MSSFAGLSVSIIDEKWVESDAEIEPGAKHGEETGALDQISVKNIYCHLEERNKDVCAVQQHHAGLNHWKKSGTIRVGNHDNCEHVMKEVLWEVSAAALEDGQVKKLESVVRELDQKHLCQTSR